MTFVIFDNNELLVRKMKAEKKQLYLELFQITKSVLKMNCTAELVIQTSLDLHVFLRNRAIKQMEEKVLHAGVIQEVSENKLTVSIISASACSSCHAKGACLASDMKEKEIDIYHFSGNYFPGQHVNIVGRTSQGYKAAFYGYVLPFILVFATLLTAVAFTTNEAIAGLLSLAVLIPYYAVLYFFRNKLKNSFDFEISATN